ncbi:sugar ABC transporter ATP-binding protein [Vibrio breoganii]|uniref:Sugar ABC transporter ATP-binding protein n=1 Tax=Vibrio breoganii TaxID=553239 RepID=A0AAN1CRF6_9VIBR|nr:sn-glycerol-3-phosphate ABC transporter ATP-binding protein UgpC [Vibrio breoganii]ANO32466.1 sugar ABC transporter ATP-binding protein [Vibrio breoganii]MDN3717744.1 sn-glycerol-3-phosphate ABC transporter ATP-binding protein UgpC [Vibrio breoganii]PMG76099.1 sugar ABC transporter ATP-binding protein [Vibrio breoganii]PMG92759.1 sugar ABC transporter ATP-binding protein [Vibrio breoganii]PMK41432.1 sugar ABC transporter ATP-binding protein [Vibrio breoganii]
MAKVTLEGINKVYDNGYHAIHDVSLDIKDGEFMVLVGPSGCAKSTMLRMVAGLESITSGQLFIGDKVCNDLPPKDRGIAMVFQNYALYPHMTTYENMAFGLETAKKSKQEIKRRVSEAAELLEITDLLDRKPNQMSGGQCQRVALGRAMVRKPEVFLFDEPLSNLDAKLRVSMRMRITRLHQQLQESSSPATMVYVTHDQVEAMTMGDRVCILNKGHIMQVDTPMNVYHNPKNRFVAEFIGSPAMNMFAGKVSKFEGSVGVDFGGKLIELPAERHTRAELWTDKNVHVGIRPEHIAVRLEKGSNTLSAEVEAIEELGSEVYVHLNVLGCHVICKQSDREQVPAVGSRCHIELLMDKCHLFDDSTENNIFYS